jgi:hypothetical protein
MPLRPGRNFGKMRYGVSVHRLAARTQRRSEAKEV